MLLLLSLLPVQTLASKVRVCTYDNPPLSFTDAQGRSQGLLPDLIREVASHKNWQLSFVSAEWNDCLQMLEQGEVDLLPAIAYTEERAKKFRFVREAVMTNWGQIFQQPGKSLDSILDLRGKKLAVVINDVHYRSANGVRQMAEHFDIPLEFVEVAGYPEAFARLAAGEVDAALANRLYGLREARKFSLQPTSILLNPIQVRPAFASSSDPVLATQFDQTLADWKQSSSSIYFRLLDKWLADQDRSQLPSWWWWLLSGLLTLLLVALVSILWVRRMVTLQTAQLAEKNRQLEDELIERLQVEKELLERQQQYQVLFEESHTSMLLIDPSSAAIVDVNPAACHFYQYPREAMQGMRMSRLNGLSEAEIQSKMQRIKDVGGENFQLTHRLADGTERLVEVHSSPIQVAGRSLLCSIVHDISARKAAEAELNQRNQFLQSVIDAVADPIMVITTDYRVIKMNRVAREMLEEKYADQEEPFCHLVSHASNQPCDGSDHPCPLQQVQQTKAPVSVIHYHTTSQGRRTIELNASPLFDAEGKLYAIVEAARDITERLQATELLNENEKRLHHLAHHDPLTDLPNRLLFEDRMRQALSKARRSGKQVALFFLDLDHFKDINDNLGHDYGDLLLIDIAKRLRSSIRESDTVARMGGDEFLVLLEEIDSLELVDAMAERICESLTHEVTRNNYYQRVSASIGISLFPGDGETSAELLRNADQAMYRAKREGKATYQYFSSPQTGFLFD